MKIYYALIALICISFSLVGYADATELNIENIHYENDLKPLGFNLSVKSKGIHIKGTYELDNKHHSFALVPIKDTFLHKNQSSRNNSSRGKLILRDNNFCRVLLQFDTSSIPSDAKIIQASLMLTPTWYEKKNKPAEFAVFNMLVPWDNGATYEFSTYEKNHRWDGLKSGRDFDGKRIGQIRVKSASAHQTLEIKKLESTVSEWVRDGTNYGLALSLWGGVMQANLNASANGDAMRISLNGEAESDCVLEINNELLQKLSLQQGDIKQAHLRLSITGIKGDMSRAALVVYPVSPEGDNLRPKLKNELSRLSLSGVKPGTVRLEGLADVFNQVSVNAKKVGFAIRLEGAGRNSQIDFLSHNPGLALDSRKAVFELDIQNYPQVSFHQNIVRPRPGVYVERKASKLYYGGERLKLFGVCVHPRSEAVIKRLARHGFNGVRLWGGSWYSAESAARGEFDPNHPAIEEYDKAIYHLKKHGLFVINPTMIYLMPKKGITADNSFLRKHGLGEADWSAWKKGVLDGHDHKYLSWFKYFDERLHLMGLRHAKNVLTHKNKFTGKHNYEEEAIAVFGVDNENGFLKFAFEKNISKWPPYFYEKFTRKWNQYLTKKYKTQQNLIEAWGKVDKGESLKKQTVVAGPMLSKRNDYPEARVVDFVSFVTGMVADYTREVKKIGRSLAPPGVGSSVIPFSSDTQYRNNIPWLYSKTAAGDVNMYGIYVHNYNSALAKPPRLYVVDANRVKDQPTILYEVNTDRPNPYRTEFPMILAAMGAHQDFDGIFYHYWSSTHEEDMDYLKSAMPIVQKGWADGLYYHANDPVMTSSMSLAAKVFMQGKLPEASNPVTVTFGPSGYNSYRYFNGAPVEKTAFSKGVRIAFDPNQQSPIHVTGELTKQFSSAVKSGPYTTWDYPKERLVVDSPLVKLYVGKTVPGFRFNDGIVLSEVNHPFVTFAMISLDGKPLANGCRSYMSNALFDAKNTGFEFDWENVKNPNFVAPNEAAKLVKHKGRGPVLIDKVDYRITFPFEIRSSVDLIDFAFRKSTSDTANMTPTVSYKGDLKRWMNITSIGSIGNPFDTTGLHRDIDDASQSRGIVGKGEVNTWPEANSQPHPIAGISWGMSFSGVSQLLWDSSVVRAALKPDAKSQSISIIDTDCVLEAPGDVTIEYRDGKMRSLSVAFTRPEGIEKVMTRLSRTFGDPVSKKISNNAFDENVVIWKFTKDGLTQIITLKEHQSNMGVTFTLK